MKIDRLTIQNFKCFKAEKTFDFGRITILTGANSSGKSSVIYATLIAIQSEGFPNSLSPNGIYVRLGDFKQIANNHDSTKHINLELSFQEKMNKYELFTTWLENTIDYLPYTNANGSRINGILANSAQMRFDNDILINKLISNFREKESNYISAFRQSPEMDYKEQNKANFKVGTDGQGYIDQIVEWEKRGNGQIKRLVELMKDMELIEYIKINRLGGSRFEVLVKAFKNSLLTSLSNVGFGVSQFLPIMVADLQLPDDSTLFLAEPEIHLHPSVQAKFGDYIVKQVNETQKNYVIETHSEYFLNRIRLAIVKGELKKEDIKVYFLENNGDDTDVFDVEFTKVGGIKNAPDTFFETYSMDVMDIAYNAIPE